MVSKLKLSCIFSLLLFVFLFLSSSKVLATVLFQDTFHDVDGTVLSLHNPHWSFVDLQPGTGNWGEYQIHSNRAGDGGGAVYNVNKLDLTLPQHFLITENFTYSPTVSSDANLAFMEMRIDSITNGEYLFRFDVDLPQTGITLQTLGPTVISTILGNYNPIGINTISVEYNAGLFIAKINNVVVLTFTDSSVIPDHILISQSRFIPTSALDSFQLDDLGSPSPTLFPITHFSQRDPVWKDQIYDTANLWAPGKTTIERWGCALTSASTILDYYGITTLPDHHANNPGNINAWLKAQPDGYFGQGLINWNAVSRASKLVSIINPTLPSLEYKRKGTDLTDLHTRLGLHQPVILEEPGHFITAYQYLSSTNTTDIIDPYWGIARSTLGSYGNTYLSTRTYTPSHTNLGYIIVSADQNISSQIATFSSYIQQPIVDQTDPPFVPTSLPLQLLEYPQPADGAYQLHLHRATPGIGSFELYIYDVDGNPIIIPVTAFFGTDDLIFSIVYHKNGGSVITKQVGFETLKQDIVTAQIFHLFKSGYDGQSLLALITNAQKLYPKQKGASVGPIHAFLEVFSALRTRIDPIAYEVIAQDTKLLLSQLY